MPSGAKKHDCRTNTLEVQVIGKEDVDGWEQGRTGEE